MPPAPPRQPAGTPPAATSAKGVDPQDLDALRARLNESLQQRRFDDAVEAARSLRDLLKSKPVLNPRELKSLAGAESVLRRFAEEGSTDVSGARKMKIVWAVGTAVVVLSILLYAIFHRYGPEPYTRAAEKALEALDHIDGAVSKPLSLGDYQSTMRKEREAIESFLSKYRDEKRGDLGFAAIAASLSAYDSVMTEWPKSPASSKRLSTSEVEPKVPFPRLWLAAHAYEAIARRVVRKEPAPTATVDAANPLARLVGHWSDGTTDVYYSPTDPATGIGIFITRSSRTGATDVAAYENAPPPALKGEAVFTRPRVSATPTAGSIELRIVQYLPRASTLVVRVSVDHLAGGTLQLVKLDDKTQP